MTSFPVKVDQRDNVIPADINADTSVTLYADGTLTVATTAYEWTDLHGGHVGVVVLLYDANQHWLTSTSPVRYGLDGKWIGTSQITTSFNQTIDKDTMSQVAYVAIKHYNAPNDAWTDIQAWLKGAEQVFTDVADIVKKL
jgi:hypothetical protein